MSGINVTKTKHDRTETPAEHQTMTWYSPNSIIACCPLDTILAQLEMDHQYL